MKLGDLVDLSETRWLVYSLNRQLRTVTLLNFAGENREVPADLDKTHTSDCGVICNPAECWPFVVFNSNGGGVTRIVRNGYPMDPFIDWVIDPMQTQRPSIYFNPLLLLQPAEVLTVYQSHRKMASRLDIPRTFGSFPERKARTEAASKVREKTAYDHLLADDDED